MSTLLAEFFSTKYQGCSSEVHNLVKNFPIIAPFDFVSAFPTIIQKWVWLVLEHRKLSQSFLTLLHALYVDAKAVSTHRNCMWH